MRLLNFLTAKSAKDFRKVLNTNHAKAQRRKVLNFFATSRLRVLYYEPGKPCATLHALRLNKNYKLKFNPRTMFLPMFGIPSVFNLERCAMYFLSKRLFPFRFTSKACFPNFTVPPKPRFTKV